MPEDFSKKPLIQQLGQFFGAYIIVVSAAGCTLDPMLPRQPDPVLLRHPQTGKTVRCDPYPAFHGPPGSLYSAAKHEKDCIEDYQATAMNG
jgi:hypothetical protein